MNITKRDVLELRRRLTKKACSFQKMFGCYVNGNKEILLQFTEDFTELEEDEFFKYLEIAKKALSGTLGNNLLELSFTTDELERQQFFLMLKSSKLNNPELLERFYEQVIENYAYAGNYLILLFHDVYDVMTRTKDREKLDESEEIYEYIICAICPVELSKPGLEYQEQDHKIGVQQRDWVVGMPDIGFVYPAFSDRSSDVNAFLYYNKKESHPEFVTKTLGCEPQRTAHEEKQLFQEIVQSAFGTEEEQADAAFLTLQRNLDGLIDIQEEELIEGEPLTTTAVTDLIADIDMPDEVRTKIEQSYQAEFGETPPTAKNLLDRKMAAEGMQRAQTMELQKKITSLQEQLNEQQTGTLVDRLLQQIPESRRQNVHTQLIDGQRYLLIPLQDDEELTENA